MPKTASPGMIEIPGIGEFQANAVPDPFDDRDLVYRPKLAVLPRDVDARHGRHVYRQAGQSCTGHAVAAVINHVLRATSASKRVSPYMLYRLARRYDEFPGDADAGSSLRGALKGWFHHGAALERAWPTLEMDAEPDLDDDGNLRAWRDRPLGAFYRVNPFRLDDVQSAITELFALAVSSLIHEGWREPVRRVKDGHELYVITRPVDAKVLGGHAYCLVGYNEVGFLVQNSWGTDWGKGGYATLPYEDWLDSAYDAWVARPGVPHTPFYSGRSRTAKGTGGELVTAVAPDLRRLAYHVVNTGNDGGLSSSGKFVSTPAQVDRAFEHMGRWHDFFLAHGRSAKRHVVLWAHGGGVAEESGLAIANRQLNWWLNNGIYPITFVWETGPLETFGAALEDLVRGVLPAGGVGFDLVEQLDRLVEGLCRRRLRWAWREMKENAERASDGAPGNGVVPGAALVVDRLAAYADAHGRDNVAIHLVAHSAGSIYQAAMLDRFAAAGLSVDTLTWLAPAITVERFRQRALPHLGSTVRRFACVDLSDALELDDTVGPVYHKSAVYLVARGFEDALGGTLSEVPILGLAKCWTAPDGSGRTLLGDVRAAGGDLVVARCASPADARTDAMTHAAFDQDAPTLTSVAMRVLGLTDDPARVAYQSYAPLADPDGSPWAAAGPVAAGAPAADRPAVREPLPTAARVSAGEPGVPVEAAAPGEVPLLTSAEAPPAPPAAPALPAGEEAPLPEVAVAPRSGSPILDVLAADGWLPAD